MASKRKQQKKDFGHSAELKAHATDVLNGVATTLHDLSERFGEDGHEECQQFYAKKAEMVLRWAGWYDEAAAARAKKERLEAQLAEVEAQLAEAEGVEVD